MTHQPVETYEETFEMAANQNNNFAGILLTNGHLEMAQVHVNTDGAPCRGVLKVESQGGATVVLQLGTDVAAPTAAISWHGRLRVRDGDRLRAEMVNPRLSAVSATMRARVVKDDA